jgi:PhzF family phenazine biosynthesis protein
MRELRLWQVDAFAAAPFRGNPAAVVPMDEWLPDATLQAIALENNLAETAFLVGSGRHWKLRWFTPAIEIVLCGHATLASGYVIDKHLSPGGSGEIAFDTQSGRLTVVPENGPGGERYRLSLPAYKPHPVSDPVVLAAVAEAIGTRPEAVLQDRMMLAVLGDQAAVEQLRPDLRKVATLPSDGVIVTGPGRDADFVSRYFVPQAGIDEDPVTGSAHCLLAPYWGARLGKREFFARQVSKRGGELWLRLEGDRVSMAGKVQPYLEGRIVV